MILYVTESEIAVGRPTGDGKVTGLRGGTIIPKRNSYSAVRVAYYKLLYCVHICFCLFPVLRSSVRKRGNWSKLVCSL